MTSSRVDVINYRRHQIMTSSHIDVIIHMTSPLIWRHHLRRHHIYDIINTTRHQLCDIISHVTSSSVVIKAIVSNTSSSSWRHQIHHILFLSREEPWHRSPIPTGRTRLTLTIISFDPTVLDHSLLADGRESIVTGGLFTVMDHRILTVTDHTSLARRFN